MVAPFRNYCDQNCCFLAHSTDETEDQKECVCGLSKVPVLASAGPGVHLSCLLSIDAGHWGLGDGQPPVFSGLVS